MILSRQEKKEKLNSFIEEIKDVVVVTFNNIAGASVDNVDLYWATMSYRIDKGFYISTTGTWVSAPEAKLYADKLSKLASIAEKLNALYVPEK